MMRFWICNSSADLVIERPGSVVGMYMIVPSFRLGMNSEPSFVAGMSVYGLDGRVHDCLVYLFTFGSEYPFIRRSIQRLGLKRGDRVLDWGCGTGISLKHIQSVLPEGRVYALDRSPRMAKYAVGRAQPNQKLDYHFMLREGTGVDLPEKVSATIASYSLCVLRPRRVRWRHTGHLAEHYERRATADSGNALWPADQLVAAHEALLHQQGAARHFR
jgi:SAM-dependent methyltransferase